MTVEDTELALYRRYRPQNFASLVGQETIANALVTAVETGRVRGTYLFSGPRGCGKTSAARIFAKALNCENPVGAEPCNRCDSCISITEGTSLDVIEFDAASKSGVDAMRGILSDVALASPGKKKVYIIDEAHMLSTSASNASLKTLEEPPPHVVFILATTDSQKIIGTIRSRSQHFSFKLVRPDVLTKHLEFINDEADLHASKEVINAAVMEAKGSVRDALSALDRLVLTGVDEAPRAVALLEALVTGEVANVFKAIAKSIQDGVGARVLAEETLELLRECFLLQMGVPELLSTSDWGTRAATAKALGPRRTVQAIDAFGEAVSAMQSDFDQRVNLEIAAARFCKTAKA